ncbi:GH25 family lysozyme [Bacillus gobiensis]|uniref:glycoside hydrolase family 25 protein n=1 Tax=Bacillus gobiensis TaxID=1441095 RepID=UPI003D22FD1F
MAEDVINISKGIDVSHWQGDIDWGKVAADGISFAFLKATEGTRYVDPTLYKNADGARSAGIKVGAYHFARFGSKEEAQAEANHFLNTAKKTILSYPLVLDLEINQKKVSKSDLTDAAVFFLEELEKSGNFAMLYTGKSFLESALDETKLEPYAKWIARYNNELGRAADIWQYSSKGKVNGIQGNVDMNLCYLDGLPAMVGGGLKQDSVKPSKPVQKPTHEKPSSAPKQTVYTIERDDTLSGIANRFKTSVKALQSLNDIKNPNLIHPGQKLKVFGSVSKPAAKQEYYTIKSGDTLSGIAAKHNSSVKQLQAWNHIKNANKIYAGQKIRVK